MVRAQPIESWKTAYAKDEWQHTTTSTAACQGLAATEDTRHRPTRDSVASKSWMKLKTSVVGDKPKKDDDIWDSIHKAVAEVAGATSEHKNDENDREATFSFRSFRRDLSILRRSQHGSQNTVWSGDSWVEDDDSFGGSAGSGEGPDEETEEDGDVLVSDHGGIDTQQEVKKVDRRGLMVRSEAEARKSSLTSFTLARSMRRGGIHSSLQGGNMQNLMWLTKVEEFTRWA